MIKKLSLLLLLVGASLVTGTAHAAPITESAFQLRRDMAKLWSDHVFWTRLYIESALEKRADLKVTTDRLLKNQDDIGNAIANYYGKAAGSQLAKLLRDHIMIAADVIKSAQAGNKDQLKINDDKWHKNADEIALFLNKANSKNWGEKEMRDMLYNHLKLTTDEVVARINRKWSDDVKIFDQVLDQALAMGQSLANGIIAQFQPRFNR